MTEKEFEEYVEKLEAQNLDNDTEYKLYNEAFEKTYGHPAFNEDGNFWGAELR